jgi:hypothetical protein
MKHVHTGPNGNFRAFAIADYSLPSGAYNCKMLYSK